VLPVQFPWCAQHGRTLKLKMPLMVWNNRLSVGVKVIDDEHKRLLSLANDLYDAIVDQRKEQLATLLKNY
jgi:hemerythrin